MINYFFRQDSLTAPSVRKFFTELSRDSGVAVFGAEWMCPLGAEFRRWFLCGELPISVLARMPIDVVVMGDDAKQHLRNHLSAGQQDFPSRRIIEALASDAHADSLKALG